MDVIETEHLHLRPFTRDDFDFLYELNADPDVARFIGSGKPRTRRESEEWLEKTLRCYACDNSGHLAVVLKRTSMRIGRCGLSRFDVEVRTPGTTHPLRCYWGPGSAPQEVETEPVLELGYMFAKAHWGQGYATEAARAVRDDAFRTRRDDALMSLIFPRNHASKKVAVKSGFRLQDRVEVFGSVVERYVISRERWRAELPGRPSAG